MIQDITTQLATAYAPTAQGTTYPSAGPAPGTATGISLDLGAKQDWGMGHDWYWFLWFSAAAASAGSATWAHILQGNDTDSAFSTGTTVSILDDYVTEAAPVYTTFTLGYQWSRRYPRGFTVRYLRIADVIGTAALTAGTYSSWLGGDQDNIQDNLKLAAAGFGNPG